MQLGACDTFISPVELVVNGAVALVPSELNGAIATNDFSVFEIRTGRVLHAYLRYCLF
jgi:hypothetical protein